MTHRRISVLIVFGALIPAAFFPFPMSLEAQEQGQEVVAEVALTEGTAEVSIPDVGWRRAVLGRRLLPESLVTTWRDSRVLVSRGETTVEIGPVSHLGILGIRDDLLRIRFDAGSLMVETQEGIIVDIPVRESRLRSSGAARFSATTRELSVIAGSVFLEVPGIGSTEVTAGRRVSLVPHDLEPIFLPKPQ
ncbi:MAG: hypothetical protein ACLFPV_12015 [Spirochaetaceae bacterium]